jgi:BolA protein
MIATKEEIIKVLTQLLQPSYLNVQDEAHLHADHTNAGLGHFRVTIVADCFIGKTRLTRHRMVYNAFKSLVGVSPHAVAIRALTSDEYARFDL